MQRLPADRASDILRYLWHGLRKPGRLVARRDILIAGLPKTGTTALYYAIKATLPFARGIFEPADPAEALAEETRRSRIVKCLVHPANDTPLAGQLERFSRRVLLLRDPRDRMISSQLYHLYHAGFTREPAKRQALLALLTAKEQAPDALPFQRLCAEIAALGGQDFFRQIAGSTQRFEQLLQAWAEAFHLLRYEDFVAGRLAPLSTYLDLPLRAPGRLRGAPSRVLRSGTAGDWRNWLTEADVAALRPLLQPSLARMGYGEDWRLNRPERLDPALGSDYVRRLLRERDGEGGG